MREVASAHAASSVQHSRCWSSALPYSGKKWSQCSDVVAHDFGADDCPTKIWIVTVLGM
jgi:hypothetical protein